MSVRLCGRVAPIYSVCVFVRSICYMEVVDVHEEVASERERERKM